MTMTFLDKKKIPFAATKAGLLVNTILGLPRATVDVGKDVGRSVARNVGSVGVTVAKKFGGEEEMAAENIKNLFGQELWRNTFGDEPLKAIEDRVVEVENTIKESPFAKNLGLDKFATPLAFGRIMGSTALDLTPFGGLEKNATKQILKETSIDGAFRIAKQLGADDEVAKVIAPIFASTKTEQEATKSLEVYKSLRGTKALAEGSIKTASDISPDLQPLVQEARKGQIVEPFELLGKKGYGELIENYKGRQILKLRNGEIATYEPTTKKLFRISLDDSTMQHKI